MKYDRSEYISQPIPIERELATLFKQKKRITIFEIGACEGEDSVRYSRLFPNSIIYAFEPLPKNIEWIKKNLDTYKVQNVLVCNKALSANVGTAEFFVSDGQPKDVTADDWDFGNKSSSLLPPDEHMKLVEFIQFNNRIEVETTTLKAFCNENKITKIDFIHMDVQGAELFVLEGAGDMLSNIKAIWLEVAKVSLYKDQPLVNDVEVFMDQHNFVLMKNCVNDLAGDQLYISKKHFPNYKKIFAQLKPSQSIFRRVLNKLGIN
jgi:2-O-methyltransferase